MFHLSRIELGWTPGTGLLMQTFHTLLQEALGPISYCAGRVAKRPRHFAGRKPMQHERDRMEAMQKTLCRRIAPQSVQRAFAEFFWLSLLHFILAITYGI